jgi:selenide, water dikinase
LSELPKQPFNENLIVGFETADDAGVYRLSDELAIVQTLDFLPPIVDDPHDYGRIAALNSINDVWAMAGTPVTAIAIACFPESGVDPTTLQEINCGGMGVLINHNISLIGGHSVNNKQIMFGYSVTGIIDPRKIATNSGAQPGDVIILTKPIGTGVISAGTRVQKTSEEIAAASLAVMLMAGDYAAELMRQFGVRGATDITGFALIGHAWEMACASKVTIELDSNRVPIITGALELASNGFLTGNGKTNRQYVGDDIQTAESVGKELRDLLFDPQTAGGMLIAISQDRSEELLERLCEKYPQAAIVGRVLKRGVHSIVVK